MKYKFKKLRVQKPVLIVGLLFVMIIALVVALQFYPGYEQEVSTSKRASTNENVTEGKQIARITIVDPNKSEEDYSSEVLKDPEVKEALTPVFPLHATPAGEKVQFRIDKFQKLATQPLKFRVYDAVGRELSPDYLASVNGEKVHFYLVHASLTEFLHLIPSYQNGLWNVSAFMPTPGTYYAYVVVDPIKGDLITYKYDLVVRSESPADVSKPNPTADLIHTDSGVAATLELKRFENYRALAYEIRDGSLPARILPHFESVGLVTLFQHSDPNYMNRASADAVSNEGGGSVSFSMAHLPKDRYTAFAEFAIGGKVYIFPITFDIGG